MHPGHPGAEPAGAHPGREAPGVGAVGPGRERFSFDPVEDEIVEALCSLVELAAAGTIRSTTIQTVDHGKASISVSAKGTIKVARIEARACQLEA